MQELLFRPASEREDPCASVPSSSTSSSSKSDAGGSKKGKGSKQSKRKAPDELWNEGNPPEVINPANLLTVPNLSKMMTSEDPSLDVLCLLRALNALNRYWGSMYPVTYYQV